MYKGKIDYKKVLSLLKAGTPIWKIPEELDYDEKSFRECFSSYHQRNADMFEDIDEYLLDWGNKLDVGGIDTGKILALHKAGWHAGKIAEDMRLQTNVVIDVLRKAQ